MRGLTPETDRFQVYQPGAVQDVWYWSRLKHRRSRSTTRGRSFWDAGFRNRSQMERTTSSQGRRLLPSSPASSRRRCNAWSATRAFRGRARRRTGRDLKPGAAPRSSACCWITTTRTQSSRRCHREATEAADDDDKRAERVAQEILRRQEDKEDRIKRALGGHEHCAARAPKKRRK